MFDLIGEGAEDTNLDDETSLCFWDMIASKSSSDIVSGKDSATLSSVVLDSTLSSYKASILQLDLV